MSIPAESIPVRMICATRLSESEFFAKTQAGRSVLAFRATSNVELRLYPGNSLGLSEIYNHAIEAAADDPRILVFVHDDCLIADFFWMDRVREGLKRFDLVGIVGNLRRLPGQPSWIIADLSGRQDDYANLSGAIGQGHSFPPEKLDVFGGSGLGCKLLDGVFLASYSETLHASGLRFDPRFKFHFYDMDFCRSAEKLHLSMGTILLSVVHASYGALDQRWLDAYRHYIEKWKD